MLCSISQADAYCSGDEAGRFDQWEIEWSQYLADGSLQMKGNNVYDDSGNLVKTTHETKEGIIDFETSYRYNTHNLLTGETGSSADRTYYYEHTNIWGDMDLQGNWLMVTEYLNGRPELVTIREFVYY